MLKRKNKESIIDALNDAQKFIFAPLAFQALGSMLDLGIIKLLDTNAAGEKEIMSTLNLDEYTVRTLLQIGILNKVIKEESGTFALTKMGKLFLYDDMTKANFDYVRDVCYLGASEMTASFLEQKPKGLQTFFNESSTIYPILPDLPQKIKDSWYSFDHLYSDNCFEQVYKEITKKYNSIYDIGGNTGKFEKLCLKHNKNFDITLLDLGVNIENNKKNKNLQGCKFHVINVLDENPDYPRIKNSAIFMSQFLDCFSKRDIQKILMDLVKTMDSSSTIYILEPYTDQQKFEGAEYSLTHTSLYFTCMANGVSKMYTLGEMEEIVGLSGLKINQKTDGVGAFDYTLLECVKNEMV